MTGIATAHYLYTWTLPAALVLLPAPMTSPAAEAFLLAIAMQESGCRTRRQERIGPARGFWQFEQNGVQGVLSHPRSRPHVALLLEELVYPSTVSPYQLHLAIEHNDLLACAFARLLLWTVPAPLPLGDNPEEAWQQYLDAWRPGTPRPATWAAHYALAWGIVTAT